MNTYQRERAELKNADDDVKTLTAALQRGDLTPAMFRAAARTAGAFEAEINEVLSA
jgi:predicted RNA-binding protein associated with RNAse of E/G family